MKLRYKYSNLVEVASLLLITVIHLFTIAQGNSKVHWWLIPLWRSNRKQKCWQYRYICIHTALRFLQLKNKNDGGEVKIKIGHNTAFFLYAYSINVTLLHYYSSWYHDIYESRRLNKDKIMIQYLLLNLRRNFI